MSRALRCLFALSILASLAPGQAGDERSRDQQEPAPTVKKLTDWPKFKKTKAGAVRSKVKQFRKAKVELHEKASEQLIAMGAGVAPILIPLVNDRQDGLNEHLLAVLDQVVGPEHASLLARETRRPSLEWRRYLMRKLATFRDADMAPILAAALKDKDPDIAFYAALGLLGLGRHDGLDTVLLETKKRWSEYGPLIAQILTPARAAKTASPIYAKIVEARPTDQMAGLRLLRYLMSKDQSKQLRYFLESQEFTVKRAAINTARVVHGQKPIEKLSSFQAIGMAKEWLSKL